jgi:hypothetical protein
MKALFISDIQVSFAAEKAWKEKVTVKSFLRNGRTVKAYYRKNKKRIKQVGVVTGSVLASALTVGLAVKGVRIKNATKLARATTQRASEIESDLRNILNNPEAREKLKQQAEEVWKLNRKDPYGAFARLSNPDVFQKQLLVEGIENARDKQYINFVAGGFDTTGKTSLGIAGRPNKAGVPSALSGLNMKGKLAEEGILPGDANIPFINYRLQSTTGLPREVVEVPLPFKKKITIGKYGTKKPARIGLLNVGVIEKYTADMRALMNAQLKHGYNPDAKELAATALAMQRITGKDIHLTGQCAGGLATMGAASIFEDLIKQGKKINYKVANIATPNLALYDLPKDKVITITSKKDPFAAFPGFNKKEIDDVVGHSYFAPRDKTSKDTGYEKSKQLKKLLREHFYGVK